MSSELIDGCCDGCGHTLASHSEGRCEVCGLTCHAAPPKHPPALVLRTRLGLLEKIDALHAEWAGDGSALEYGTADYSDFWSTKRKIRKVREELHIVECDRCLAAEALLASHRDPPAALPAPTSGGAK